jgi:hypothetical protein
MTDFEKKQKEVDLTHGSSVTKIKREIFEDRKNFLEKLISMQSDSGSSKPDASKKPANQSPEKSEKKEEKPDAAKETKKAPAKEDEKPMSLSQESPKAKVVKVDEGSADADSEKKTQKDTTDTQDLIDSVKKSAQKVKKTGAKSLNFDFKKAKKDKKVKAEATFNTNQMSSRSNKAIVSKGDIEQDKQGKFIDVPVSQFDKDASKIKKTLDRHAEARIDGMTKEEMEEKEG